MGSGFGATDSFGGGAASNDFGGGAPSNQFGGGAPSNNFGGGAPSNQFGGGAASNQFGGGAATSSFGGGMATNSFAGASPIGGMGGAMASRGMQWGNTRNWGPKAYGPGLNNQWAVPVNPIRMQYMLNIANSMPGTLVRVETNGEIEFTNQFGQERDFENPFELD